MKKYLKFAPLAMVGFAVLALLMMFVPQVKTDGGHSWSGTEAIFGSSLYGEKVLKFSFLNLLTYIFVLATIVFSILNYVKDNKNFLITATICAFLAMLFFFLTKVFLVPTEEIKALVQQYCDLAVGAILGGLFCFFASGIGVAKFLLDK